MGRTLRSMFLIASVLAACARDGTAHGPFDVPGDAAPDAPGDESTDAPGGTDTALPPVCSARAHGAKGDGATLDTAAIQAAVDACAGTGGTVVLEAGGTYYSGSIRLKGNLVFRVEDGATLIGSQERADWTDAGLLNATGIEDVTVEGPGTIDGNGLFWWVNLLAGPDNWRPKRLVMITDCRRVTVRDVNLRQSPGWHLHLLSCDDVLVDGLRIRTTVGDTIVSPNTDGIDIDACRHVEVRNCDIETGDDCIVLKNGTEGWRRESYDIRVHDCTCAAWANGFKIGTRPGAPVHDVVFRDSVVRATRDSAPGTRAMGGLTLVSDDGSEVYDILAENLRMEGVQAPFFLRVQERDLGDEENGRITQAGRLYGITLRNLVAVDATLPGMILGIPGHGVEGVTLDNVSITSSRGGTKADGNASPPERNLEYPDAPYFGTLPAYGLFARHVTGPLVTRATVQFHSSATVEERPAVVLEDVAAKDLSGLQAGTIVADRDEPAPP